MRLKADNIRFGYTTDKLVLNHVNFSVEEGEVTGLIAPSGYGKSTLAKILAGYMKPEEGEVVLEEKDADGTYHPVLRSGGYNPVQLIFQHPEKAVNPKWKMSKVLAENGMPSPDLLKAAGIKDEWLKRWPTELSGGELQRFCVVRALNEQTKFLIADEMTTMLDAITQAQIWNLVLNYARNHRMGVVVISHEKELVERLCTRVVDLTVV
ncbi:MAG: ATP-binding cassette domain-containing protein [Lachnospiraceae bacterium]|nr:ATP-binding cassette domain-containing protein [Lachnospiraceae bacterium]